MDRLGLAGNGAHQGRRRVLSLDRQRLAWMIWVAAVAGAGLAAALSWHAHARLAERTAALAVSWVDQRLDAVAQDLHRLAKVGDAIEDAEAGTCSQLWVEQLLEASLSSAVVRRFEWAKSGSLLRCGPQGPRLAQVPQLPPQVPQLPPQVLQLPEEAEAVSLQPRSGLSLMLGLQIAAHPVLAHARQDGTTFNAELEERALNLPSTLWVPTLAGADLGVTVLSAEGAILPIWGARIDSESAAQSLVPVAEAASSKHRFGVRVQPQARSMLSSLTLTALTTALGAVLAVLTVAALVWRRAVLRSRLVHRLGTALRRRQFEPFVQPIVDLASGRCVGGEVLMRWNHPQRGVLGPGEFIEEAERTGLIIGMSELTMRLAAHRLSPLALANSSLYFSFNVTPGQLREPGFAQQLADIFRPDTLPREQVLLELTERDFVDSRAQATLLRLKADGWRIAIDDFGTGQSSLASIERLAVDRIKIDRAFVSTIEEMTVNRPVLDAIIGLARELQVPLIAEGVETQTQWDYLATRGVASAQGYLMARPMPIGELLRWLPSNLAEPAHRPSVARLPQANPAPQLAEASGSLANSAQAGPLQSSAPLGEVSQAQRDLWRSMGANGGLEIKDRSYRMRIWPACFVGSEAVDWLVSHLRVSRSEALRCGRAMLAVGLIRHVAGEHDFKDGGFFYSLAATPIASDSRMDAEVFALKKALQASMDFPWCPHSRGLLRHQRCATGRTIVDWILQQKPVSRSRAALWAAQMMQLAALRHVYDDKPFRDDRSLYRLG